MPEADKGHSQTPEESSPNLYHFARHEAEGFTSFILTPQMIELFQARPEAASLRRDLPIVPYPSQHREEADPIEYGIIRIATQGTAGNNEGRVAKLEAILKKLAEEIEEHKPKP